MGKGYKLVRKELRISKKDEITFNRGLGIKVQLKLSEIGILLTKLNSYLITFIYF